MHCKYGTVRIAVERPEDPRAIAVHLLAKPTTP